MKQEKVLYQMKIYNIGFTSFIGISFLITIILFTGFANDSVGFDIIFALNGIAFFLNIIIGFIILVFWIRTNIKDFSPMFFWSLFNQVGISIPLFFLIIIYISNIFSY